MSMKDAMKAMHQAHQDHVKATKLDDDEYCRTCCALDKEKDNLLQMQKDKLPPSVLREKHAELAEMELKARAKNPMGMMKR